MVLSKKYKLKISPKLKVDYYLSLINKINLFVIENQELYPLDYKKAPSYEKINLISVYIEGWSLLDEVFYHDKLYKNIWAKGLTQEIHNKKPPIASAICENNHPFYSIQNDSYHWTLVKKLNDDGWSTKIIGINEQGKHYCLFYRNNYFVAAIGKDLQEAVIQAFFIAKQGGVSSSVIKPKFSNLITFQKKVLVS